MAIPAKRSQDNGVRRFTFGAFHVAPENRAAFEACSAIANLHEVSPQPVVVLGPHGAGKTHLLYAIANRVRQHARPVSMVCVSAGSFPEEAKRLADDATPLARSTHALLLVDQLERFTDRRIEDLVRVFLDTGHRVVVATRTRPEELNQFSDAFRDQLQGGTVLHLTPPATNGKAKANGHGGQTVRGAKPAPAAQEQTAPWNAVRDELGRAYKELRWALDEVERLREDNRAMAERALAIETPSKSSGGTTQALLDRAESVLNELHANRERFEALHKAQSQQIEELRRYSAEPHLETHTHEEQPHTESVAEGGERFDEELRLLRDECTRLRQSLMQAREERETDRGRLRRAHETIDRLQDDLTRLRQERAAGEPPVHPVPQVPSSTELSEPLADLEQAARAAEPDEAPDAPETTDADDTGTSDPRPHAPRRTSSLYHVEQLQDDPDLLGDGGERREDDR